MAEFRCFCAFSQVYLTRNLFFSFFPFLQNKNVAKKNIKLKYESDF